jgi:hypothetical protein
VVDIRHGSVDTPTIDRRHLWALLRCYFRLSTRGRLSQSIGHGLIAVTATYALVGVMASTIVLGGEVDVFTFAVLMHSMTFFVVGMAVTAESGDILFNANESDVLVHRPIHPRTLLLAKAINLMAFTRRTEHARKAVLYYLLGRRWRSPGSSVRCLRRPAADRCYWRFQD